MRHACVAAAVIAAIAMIASPAFAQQRKAYPQRAPQATSPGGYAAPRRGNTDPDPNVQFATLGESPHGARAFARRTAVAVTPASPPRASPASPGAR